MDEHDQSDAALTPGPSMDSSAVPSELSKLLICRALRTAKYERGRHAGFAGGVGIGGLPSIRHGDGKFFAATPPASGLRVCHLDSWHSRSFLLSDRTIVPGPAR